VTRLNLQVKTGEAMRSGLTIWNGRRLNKMARTIICGLAANVLASGLVMAQVNPRPGPPTVEPRVERLDPSRILRLLETETDSERSDDEDEFRPRSWDSPCTPAGVDLYTDMTGETGFHDTGYGDSLWFILQCAEADHEGQRMYVRLIRPDHPADLALAQLMINFAERASTEGLSLSVTLYWNQDIHPFPMIRNIHLNDPRARR
jgi:hypothetical protein